MSYLGYLFERKFYPSAVMLSAYNAVRSDLASSNSDVDELVEEVHLSLQIPIKDLQKKYSIENRYCLDIGPKRI